MSLGNKNAASARRIETAAKSRRVQLLDQAARELNSKGISMTSLTAVADKLGFSRASLYYYVEDREDLMFQVYLRSSEIMARIASLDSAGLGRSLRRLLLGATLIAAVLYLGCATTTRVDAGHVGIRVKLAGSDRGIAKGNDRCSFPKRN